MTYTGVDISKDYFDVDLRGEARQFANTPDGFRHFIGMLSADSHCIMEATGPYGFKLAAALLDAEIAVSVVNPLQVHRFSQSMFMRAKTDKADARILTLFGEKFSPRRVQPTSDAIMRLKQQRAALAQLTETRTVFTNQLHAFSQMPVKDALTHKALRSTIRTINTQIENLKEAMQAIVLAECAEIYELLRSIPGIGPMAAAEIIIVTNKLSAFTSSKQLAAYIGVAPRIFQSGTSVRGRARMCKMGMSNTRRILYLCSWSAIKCNRACKELYERMVKAGKPKMVALIAVINKLLRQMFAIVKSNKPYFAMAA